MINGKEVQGCFNCKLEFIAEIEKYTNEFGIITFEICCPHCYYVQNVWYPSTKEIEEYKE